MKKTKLELTKELEVLQKEHDSLKKKHWKPFSNKQDLLDYLAANVTEVERLDELKTQIRALRIELMDDQEREEYLTEIQKMVDKHSWE
jgi:hypothetical protein